MPTSLRSFKNSILATTILLAATASTLAQSQIPPQQPPPSKKSAIAVRSEVVLVPAVVTNHAGAHVTDLSQSEFTIFENGQPQQIAFFHHVGITAQPSEKSVSPAESAKAPPAARSDRSAILVLDFLNSSIAEQAAARDELMKFLTESSTLAEPVCLVGFDDSGVRLMQDFTRNPALLAEALKNVKTHFSPKNLPDTNPLSNQYRNVNGWHTKNKARNEAAEQGRTRLLAHAMAERAAASALRTWKTLEALREIGEAYSGVPGRKSLIWATGGFPFEISDSSHFGMGERSLQPTYESAWRTLNRANIAVYPLDVEDLINPAFVDPGIGEPLPEHGGITSDVSKLESIAEATGGKLCDRQTTALACFNTAADDASDYYMIGFYESGGSSAPGWRKLSVKVSRPNLKVQARSGYLKQAPQDPDLTRKQDIQLALLSPLDFTAVSFTVRLTTVKDANGKKTVGFLFLIPPAVVTVDESDHNHVNLDFAALAENPDGVSAEGGFSQSLEGHIKPEGATALHTQGLSFPGSMDLSPGEYSVRFVIRDNLSGQVGSTTATLKVP